MKYSCLVFGEGGRDKKFLMVLIDLPKFKYHTKKWAPFNYNSASGSSPEIILKQCCCAVFGKDYDLVLCFIDLDQLKFVYPKTWEKEKEKLEQKFLNFQIIWQIDNAEDEYKRVLGDCCYGKHKLNKAAKQNVKKFINSAFWKKILKAIKDKEIELKKKEEVGCPKKSGN